MAGQNYEKERKRIQEQIIPRKRAKRAFLTILAVIVSAAVFGVVAALMFSLTRSLFLSDDPEEPAAIIIARDDTREAASNTERGEDPADPQDHNGETGAQGSDAAGDPAEARNTGHPEDAFKYGSVKALYADISEAFATVVISKPGTGDPISDLISSSTVSFGVLVAENASSLFVLTDGYGFGEGDIYTVRIGGTALDAVLMGKDSITNLAVLRIAKPGTGQRYRIITLGNSFYADAGDRIYLIGAPENIPVSLNEGIITNIVPYEPMTDGYFQHIFTGFRRENHGSGALFDTDGEMIAWFSDFSCGSGSIVSAVGVSSVKYLLEDLCSDKETVYLGVFCVEVGEEEAALSELEAGLYVASVIPDSPAFLAGIQAGDRILSVDGVLIDSNYSLQVQLDSYHGGMDSIVELKRYIGGEFVSIPMSVTFGNR